MAKDSVLHDKAKWKDLRAYEALLKTHASEINSPSAKLQRTPLHWAAEDGPVNIVLLLIRYGADVEAKDADGATPLFIAATNNQAKIARALLDKGGASVHTLDNDGNSILHGAVRAGYPAIVRELLRHDADWTVKDADGKTALDYVDEADFDMGQAFEDFGANEDPNEPRDLTAVRLAVEDVLEKHLGHDNLDVVVTDDMKKQLSQTVDSLIAYDAFMKKVLEASKGLEPRYTMAPERLEKVEAVFKKALESVLAESNPELELDAMFESLRV